MMQILLHYVLSESQCQSDQDNSKLFNEINEETVDFSNFVQNNIFTVPCGVQIIDQQLQYYQEKSTLVGVIIPDSVTTINQDAFKDLKHLTSIYLPDSIEQLGQRAFKGCDSLQYVRLPLMLETIQEETFSYTGLRQIDLPRSVSKIEEYAFAFSEILYCVGIQNNQCINAINAFYNTAVSDPDTSCGTETPLKDCTEETKYIALVAETNKCYEEANIKYFIKDGEKLYAAEQCPEDLLFLQQETLPQQCMASCQEGYNFYLTLEKQKICQESCENGQQEYYINDYAPFQCVGACQYEWAIKQNSKQCSSKCTFYILEDIKYCTEECGEDYLYTLVINERTQCSKDCTDTGNYAFILETSCLSSCPGEYANPYGGESQVCDNTCMFYIYDETRYCILECDQNFPLQVQSERKQCTEDCANAADSDYKYKQDQRCVLQCDVDQDYVWMQETECVKSCYGIYASNYSTNVCSNECNFEITEQGEKVCVQDCQRKQMKTEISKERYQCSSNCNNIVIPNRTYKQGNECVETCTGEWALPVVQEASTCSDTCNYYVIELDQLQQKQCIKESQCPSNYQYKLQDGNRFQCLEQCDNDHKYQEKEYCVEACTKFYAQINEQDLICSNACNFKLLQPYEVSQKAYCIYDNQCNETQLTIKFSSGRFQCLEHCNEAVQTELQFQQDQTCVIKCEQTYYYQTEQNDQICISSCSQMNLHALNIQNYECTSVETCEQYYHFNVDGQSDQITCKFDQQVTQCYDYDTLHNLYYPYSYQDSTECTACQSQNQKLIQVDSKFYCTIDTSSDKNSTGAIVGGVIGGIVVIVLIIVIVVLCVKKNKKQSKPDVELQEQKQHVEEEQKQDENQVQTVQETVNQENVKQVEQQAQDVEAEQQQVEQQQIDQQQEQQQEQPEVQEQNQEQEQVQNEQQQEQQQLEEHQEQQEQNDNQTDKQE